MTSSLVGSEMCIRDRFFAHGRRSIDIDINQPPPTSIHQHPSTSFVLGDDCLLYTSDAADDM
eukprot:5954373-Prorocentrum_lima.AAC.1